MLGDHALKAHTRKQTIIARSSAEAELCAAALGASESKGIVPLLRDLGYEMKPVLAIDAKATEHILHRQGIGKLKHIDVAHLWMQDDIRSKRLRVRSVKSEENVADLGAKPPDKTVIAKHCLALGYVNMAEENVQCERQVVAIFWGFGSAVSSQQQSAATGATSSNRSSGSKRARRPTRCLQAISRSSQETVRDVREKLSTSLWITTRTRNSHRLQKVRTWRILTSSQTETSSLRAPNVSVAQRCCSSRVSLAKKPAESTRLLP